MGDSSSSAAPPGHDSTAAASRAQASGMLLALNTVVLRIAPATQRRVLEDGAGIRKERWAATVLDQPVLVGPPPALLEDPGALSTATDTVSFASCHSITVAFVTASVHVVDCIVRAMHFSKHEGNYNPALDT